MPKAHEPGTPRSHSLTTRPPPVHAKRVRADLSCHRKPCADRSWRFCSAKKKKKEKPELPSFNRNAGPSAQTGSVARFFTQRAHLLPAVIRKLFPWFGHTIPLFLHRVSFGFLLLTGHGKTNLIESILVHSFFNICKKTRRKWCEARTRTRLNKQLCFGNHEVNFE